MSPQRRVEVGSKELFLLAKSSPILKLPKKAVQAQVQKTLLLFSDQSVCAISCPRILSRGREKTFLEGLGFETMDSRLLQPLRRAFVVKLEKLRAE